MHRGLQHDGRVGTVECGRAPELLRDDTDGLVVWVASGSAAVRRTTIAGEPVRYLALDQRLNHPTMPVFSEWRGPGVLIVTPPQSRHAIWWFFEETGEFRSWYINMQTPVRRWWRGRTGHPLY